MKKEEPQFERAQGRPVFHTALNRRDIRQFLDKPISSPIVEDLLYSAIWAPNHKLTEPWKFKVFAYDKRRDFIELYIRSIKSLATDESTARMAERKVEKVEKDFEKIPLFIIAAYVRDDDQVRDQENLITVSCGLQNMLLCAEEMGIGMHWSSGAAVRCPAFHDELGFAEKEEIIGLFQAGYYQEKGTMKRSHLSEFVEWK